jgi:hypothetical protein
MSRFRREIDPAVIGIIVCSAVYIVWALLFIWDTSFITIAGERGFCLFDDAMISMRYAANLVDGYGLVWNPGERVEGITNLGMTLFMAIWIAVLGARAALPAVQLSGLLFMIGIATCTLQIGRILAARAGLEQRKTLTAMFFAAGLLFYPLSYWSLMGMETGLLALLLAVSVWLVLRFDDVATPLWSLTVLLGLAFMTRPDAAIPIAVIVAYRFLCVRRQPGGTRSVIIESALVGLFVIATTLFRLFYYGLPVPNTYLLKMTGAPLLDRLSLGLEFVEPLVQSLAIPLVIAALALLSSARRETAFLVALVIASIGYQVAIGGDAWAYWRHSAPFVPLAFVVAVVESVLLVRARRSMSSGATRARGRNPRLELGVALLVLMVSAERVNDAFEAQYWFRSKPYQVEDNAVNVNTALILNELLSEDATVGVFWAGSIPYFTGLRGIDILGRCDPDVARLPVQTSARDREFGAERLPGHNKFNLEYSVKELRPTYLQYGSWGGQSVELWAEENYTTVWHESGISVRLLRSDPSVRWDLIRF